MDGLKFAALDLVQHRLAGHPEDLGGLIEPDPAVGDVGDDAATSSSVMRMCQGPLGCELFADEEPVPQPPIERHPDTPRICSALVMETTGTSSSAGVTLGG